ncbi:hypothetical protein L226DRAFT_577068, partial [Lentinus tigrinus ALCF2SS1-7]|uniref:uncharacterized protein n=1 Tax=Lentinus tigrinus ALCF2SS1-7 TaxID=1328758 RepID=UPI001165E3AE
HLEPAFRRSEHEVVEVPTGLQSDGSSCGFWCLLFAWGRLLHFDLHQAKIQALAVDDLKEIFQAIWTSYVEDEGGLLTEVVEEVFKDFEPTIAWESLPRVFSPRPMNQQACTDSVLELTEKPSLDSDGLDTARRTLVLNSRVKVHTSQETAASQEHQLIDPSIATRTDVRSKLAMLRESPSNTNWTLGKEAFQTWAMEALCSDQGLSKFLMDPLLGGVVTDLRLGMWDMAFGPEPNAMRPALDRSVVDKGLPAPKSHRWGFWYRQDIFDYHLLIIPGFWVDFSHWMTGIVDFREKTIHVYDSLHEERRAEAFLNRIWKHLEWEHNARRSENLLQAGWVRPNGRDYAKVPQQGRTMNCGLYAIKFILEVLCGRDPADPGLKFDAPDAALLRDALVLRLVQALPIELPSLANKTAMPIPLSETTASVAQRSPHLEVPESKSQSIPALGGADPPRCLPATSAHSEGVTLQMHSTLPSSIAHPSAHSDVPLSNLQTDPSDTPASDVQPHPPPCVPLPSSHSKAPDSNETTNLPPSILRSDRPSITPPSAGSLGAASKRQPDQSPSVPLATGEEGLASTAFDFWRTSILSLEWGKRRCGVAGGQAEEGLGSTAVDFWGTSILSLERGKR